MNQLSRSAVDHVATLLITPARRVERPSSILWDQTFDVAAPGGRIACWSSGSGPIVVLVHGWEATHTDLDAFVAPLLAEGRRVVTFDFPAHGASEGTTATIPGIADVFARVAGHVGPVEAVIAHSMGCPVAATALERGVVFERLVMIAPPERFSQGVAAVAALMQVAPLDVEAALLARGLDVPSLDLPKTAATLTTPVLIVHSADDRVVTLAGARRTHAAWRGSRLIELDGLGHSRILRDPLVVQTAVDFVIELSG